jgi:uncharacterized protein YcfL
LEVFLDAKISRHYWYDHMGINETITTPTTVQTIQLIKDLINHD